MAEGMILRFAMFLPVIHSIPTRKGGHMTVRNALSVAAAIAVAALVSGCSMTSPAVSPAGPVVAAQDGGEVPTLPDTGNEAPKPPESAVKLMRRLTDTPNANYADAYRLACIVHTGKTSGPEVPADSRQALVDAGLIGSDWDGGEGMVEHQDAAFLFARAMNMPGGVMWSVVGGPRYAHREMIDRGLFPRQNPRQYMSGAELLSAFRDCREYQKANAAE